MNKFLKAICFILCAPLLLSVFLVGCNNSPSGENESDTESSVSDTEPIQSDEPDNKIDLSGDLISCWDFSGSSDMEKLMDKASNGAMLEYITPVGSGTSVRYGKLSIKDGAGNYAVIGNVEGSDIYDLANKTIVFKAKIEDAGGGLVSCILSKKNAFDLCFENSSNRRTITLRYKVNGETLSKQSTTSTPVGEERIFAIAFDVDRDSKTAKITVYRSRSEKPSSGAGMERVMEVSIPNISENFLVGSEHIYIGKRYDHINLEREMNSEITGVKIYKKVLNADEVAAVPFDMNVSDALAQLADTVKSAETIVKTAHSDAEWTIFQNVLNQAKAANENSTLEDIQGLNETLIHLMATLEIKYVSPNIGEYEKIKFNNPDIVTPIYSSFYSVPAIYDVDKDGKPDLIMQGYGRTYTGTAYNHVFLYRNRTTQGDTVLEVAEELFTIRDRFTFSHKLDGTPVFVTAEGLHTEISNQGLNTAIYYNKLDGKAFKLYDVDGDGKSDAVYVNTKSEGENIYDSNGNNLITYSATFRWIKNTGTEETPVFNNSAQPLLNESGEELIIADPTQYAHVRSFTMFDWDGDGDTDLIAGGWLNEFYYYENVGTASQPRFKSQGVRVETENGPMKLDCCRYNMIGYDWDGDGKEDLIMGSDAGDALYFRFTGRFNPTTGAPIFEEQKNFSTKAEYLATPSLCRPTMCDFDGDGDVDMIVGEGGGHLYYIENISGGTNPKWAAPVKLTDENGTPLVIKGGVNGSMQGTQEAEWGYTIPVACDWDGDGDFDIICNSITGRIVWFENIGTPTNPQLTQPKAIEVEWEGENLYPKELWWKPEGKELVTQHRTTPYAIDFNGDGLCDLVMLDHEGYLAFYERYEEGGVLKLKQGQRIFYNSDGTLLKLSSTVVGDTSINGGHIGRVKMAIVDWDGDGKLDLIVDGDKYITWYKTERITNGKYYLRSQGNITTTRIDGHNPGFCVYDWNGDGKQDLIVGTESGYIYYLENKSK